MSALKTRDALKRLFRTGSLPTEDDFGDMIDALFHVDEARVLEQRCDDLQREVDSLKKALGDLGEDTSGGEPQRPDLHFFKHNVGVGVERPVFELEVNGWIGGAGRIGTFNPLAADGDPKTRGRLHVPADGGYHNVVPHPVGSFACEVVAYAGHPQSTTKRALAYAVAVSTGARRTVRQTRTKAGWFGRRSIKLKWKKHKHRWYDHFKPDLPCDLCIKTCSDFGTDKSGNAIRIFFHVTLLWSSDTSDELRLLEARPEQIPALPASTPKPLRP